ncbi:MAG: FAD-dependent oxidoreductase, partial [Microgenomates group bacterium]
MEEKNVEYAPKPKAGEPWNVVIIGSGPASLTAAIYTARGAASTVILAGEKWGGQLMLTTDVDNFPGFPESIQGPELMQKMRKQTERFGAEFIERNVEAVDFSKKPFELIADGQKYLANSVIIATGAETRWLDVSGEDKLRGRGVSSCASCDAPLFKNKKVVVVGGGDSAMEEALVLIKYADSVTII